MRNPSSRSSSVRPLAAALLLGAALVVTEAAAPAAHAIPRSAVAALGDTASGAQHRPGVAGRLLRPDRRVRPQRRLRARASRSATRIRPRVARAARVAVPVGDDVWAKLRRCESGGRYDINTGNGFYGAYQFVPSTWRGLGYSGLPHQAPPAVQDEAASKLQARSGWGQWPVCSRRIGAR
jgi:hypothetical protein